MEKLRTLRLVIIIGAISIFFGSYIALSGALFSDYFYPIFIGITLVGTAMIQMQQIKKKNPQ